MRIAVGADHRGFDMKEYVIKLIREAGHTAEDFGSGRGETVDYPDIAEKVSKAVARGDYDYGILICGTGIGMSIAANKVKGIRAALCTNAFSAQRARQHNDANICTLAAEEGKARVPSILEAFLKTPFEGGRHQKRIEKITALEGPAD